MKKTRNCSTPNVLIRLRGPILPRILYIPSIDRVDSTPYYYIGQNAFKSLKVGPPLLLIHL